MDESDLKRRRYFPLYCIFVDGRGFSGSEFFPNSDQDSGKKSRSETLFCTCEGGLTVKRGISVVQWELDVKKPVVSPFLRTDLHSWAQLTNNLASANR